MVRPRGSVSSVDALGASIADTKARAAALEIVAHTHAGFLGGIIVCTSATRPVQFDGAVIYETDTNRIYVSDGSSWRLWGGVVSYTSTTLPATPADGTVVWETDTDRLVAYNGSAWVRIWPPLMSDVATIGAQFYRNAALNLANNTFTDITWDAVSYQQGATFLTVPGINVTYPLTGKYLLTTTISYPPNANNLRFVGLWQGGVWLNYRFADPAGGIFGQMVNSLAVVNATAGQTVKVQGYQNSGVALNVAGFNTVLSITYLGT